MSRYSTRSEQAMKIAVQHFSDERRRFEKVIARRDRMIRRLIIHGEGITRRCVKGHRKPAHVSLPFPGWYYRWRSAKLDAKRLIGDRVGDEE